MMLLVAHVDIPQSFSISATNRWNLPSSARTTLPPHDVVLAKDSGGGYAGVTSSGFTRLRLEQWSPVHAASQMQTIWLLWTAVHWPFRLQSESVVQLLSAAAATTLDKQKARAEVVDLMTSDP
jgi:hypothetical protein